MSTPPVNQQTQESKPWYSFFTSMIYKEQSPAVKALKIEKEAIEKDCKTNIELIDKKIKTAEEGPQKQLSGGGRRRRKSAKKSTNKKRRPAKKSLFNITKKWNPFAK